MNIDTPILIVGGGPVGLNMALNFIHYDVPFVLIEESTTTRQHPAGSGQNSRTMEHYRRLGVGKLVRETGLPHGHSTDVIFITRVNGYELSRVSLPAVDWRPGPESPETVLTPEPLHRANQMYVEAALLKHLRDQPGMDIRYGCRVTGFTQEADYVTVDVEDTQTGKRQSIIAGRVVACDGGQSLFRKSLGIELEGKSGGDVDFMMGRMLAVHYRAPDIYKVMQTSEPWQFQSMNTDGRASIIALDGEGSFLTHAKIAPGQNPADVDPRPFIYNIVGEEIPVEIISKVPWTAGLSLVARSYQQGRIYLAGDAVHLFTPTGGFGMNTGVDDAANLAWKLAADHQGWAGPNLLESYETERRPVAIRNLAQSYAFADAKAHLKVPPDIEDPGASDVRSQLGSEMVDLLTEEFLSIGIQLGARYDASPLTIADGTRPPADDPFVYTPSAVPGGRAPHLWLADGTALFDHLGPFFTLMLLGSNDHQPDVLSATAAELNVPLKFLVVDDPPVRELYDAETVLVRPDQHIAWRGETLTSDILRSAVGG